MALGLVMCHSLEQLISTGQHWAERSIVMCQGLCLRQATGDKTAVSGAKVLHVLLCEEQWETNASKCTFSVCFLASIMAPWNTSRNQMFPWTSISCFNYNFHYCSSRAIVVHKLFLSRSYSSRKKHRSNKYFVKLSKFVSLLMAVI